MKKKYEAPICEVKEFVSMTAIAEGVISGTEVIPGEGGDQEVEPF